MAISDQFIDQPPLGRHLGEARLEALFDPLRFFQHQAVRFLACHQPIPLLKTKRAPQRRGDHKPPLATQALDRATQAEDDHRRVRQAAVGTGGALRMRFRCEPCLPVDVIGLFMLLPAPQL